MLCKRATMRIKQRQQQALKCSEWKENRVELSMEDRDSVRGSEKRVQWENRGEKWVVVEQQDSGNRKCWFFTTFSPHTFAYGQAHIQIHFYILICTHTIYTTM